MKRPVVITIVAALAAMVLCGVALFWMQALIFPDAKEIQGPVASRDLRGIERSFGTALPSSFTLRRARVLMGQDHAVSLRATVSAADAGVWQTQLEQAGFAPEEDPFVVRIESPSWMRAEADEVNGAWANDSGTIAFGGATANEVTVWMHWHHRGSPSDILRMFE